MRIILALLLIIPSIPLAEVHLGVIHSDTTPSYQLRAGSDWYVWAAYEEPDVILVGQTMGALETLAGGLGYRITDDRVTYFIEYGYFDPKEKLNKAIVHEAAVTHLNNAHGWRGTRHFDEASYEVKPGYGGRVGLMYDITNHFTVSAAYRFLKLKEDIDAWTGECSWPPTKACKDWWRDDGYLDLSTFEAGVHFRF